MKDKLKKVISRRIIVGFFLILYAFIIIVSTRSEYLQYKEIGTQYVSIFKKNIRTRYLVLGVCFVISYLIIYLSNLGKTFLIERKRSFHDYQISRLHLLLVWLLLL